MTGKSFALGLAMLFAPLTLLLAQPCDCVSTGNCPVPITDNGSFFGLLDVTVNGTNDLGSNPLTSVCFTISHTWVGDLNVSLTSPNGTNYLLMADINNNYGGCGTQHDNVEVCIVTGTHNPLTNNTEYQCNSGPCSLGTCCLNGNWTVACGGVTDPLTGALQAPNCDLNDFNTPGAPANGTWKLTVNDVCNMDTGVLHNFTLNFANGTQACISCDADGGTFVTTALASCHGDPDLLLTLPPGYGANSPPDTALYAYAYIISQNGTILSITSVPDLTGQPQGVYQVCGLSYYIPDSSKLNALIGMSTALAFSQLNSTTAPFCGDVSSNCVTVTIHPAIQPTILNQTLCEGDCITVGGQQVCASGTFTLDSWRGCDSLVIVNLSFILPDTVAQTATVCQGGCTTVGGQSYCAPGPYYITLPNWQGCDSVIHLTFNQLTVNAVINPANPATLTCNNPSVTLDGASSSPSGGAYSWSGPSGFTSNQSSITATIPGTYSLTITNNTLTPACTSTASVTVSGSILPPVVTVSGPAPQVCAGNSFDLTSLNIQDANNTNPVITFHSNTPATPANELNSPIVSPAVTTTYYVLATNGSCSDETSVTVGVQALPSAAFTATSSVCAGSAANVTYTGGAASGASYVWNFDGGTAVPGTGSGPHSVTWATPGTYTVTLQVQQNGCVSTVAQQTVTVDGPLAQPQISCNATTQSVQFSWPNVPGATAFNVTVLSGHTGNYQPAANTYTVNGLNPGEQVSIQVVAVSGTACGNSTATATCEAQDCPTVTIDIPPVADICRTPATMPFDLSATITGGNGNGTRTWSGSGITNPANGTLHPALATIGANNYTLTYIESNCIYTQSININIYDTPTAAFTVDPFACAGNAVTVTYTGSIAAGLLYDWNFDGGVAVPGAGAGPHQVTWATGGSHTITLTVEGANGCESLPATATVQVEEPLPTPVVQCSATLTSVHFTWNAVPGAAGHIVTVLSGQLGLQTSQTSYEVNDLSPGELVNIQVEAIGFGACGNSMAQQACSALSCPNVTIVIDPVADICRSATDPPITLSANVSGASGNGTLAWSGSGITDPAAGIFNANLASLGDNTITLTYSEGGVCVYSGTVVIRVSDTPVAAFSLPAVSCEDQAAIIDYTGTVSAGMTYHWDFDGGTAVPGTGPGPHSVTWPSTGTKTISLWVENADGCVSQTAQNSIQVAGLLEEPVIQCDPTTTSIMFIWADVPGASGYSVTVLTGQAGTQTSPTTYLLTNLQPEETVTVEVTAISAGACPATTATFTCSTEPCPNIIVDAQPIADICLGTVAPFELTALVTGSDGSGLGQWSGPGIINASTGTFNPAQAGFGQHTLVFTFIEKSCTYRDSITVGIFQQPIASFSANEEVCTGEVATVTFTGTAGLGAIYTWDFGGGVAIPGNGPGPHQVVWTTPGQKNISLSIVQDGCTSSVFSIQVEVGEALSAPSFSCAATTESVIFTWDDVAGALGYDIVVLSGPAGTLISPTSYEVTGLNPGQAVSVQLAVQGNTVCPSPVITMGCAALECPGMEIFIDAVDPICLTSESLPFDLTVRVDGLPIDGTWSGPGITDPAQGTFDPILAGTGTHIVTHTLQQGNCVYTQVIDIQIASLPVADAGEDISIGCRDIGKSFQLGGMGSSTGPVITYLWTYNQGDLPGNPTIQFPTVSQPGTYTLTVSNGLPGCSATDEVTLTEHTGLPVPDLDIKPLSCSSYNDAFVAIRSVSGGVPPYFFSLNGAPFVSTDTFPFLSPGFYELEIMDAGGCENMVDFTIRDPGTLTVKLTANLVGKNFVEAGDPVQLIALVSLSSGSIDHIEWTNTELLDCDNCLDPVARPLETTTFTVTVGSNGCYVTDNLTIFVEQRTPVYVPNAFSPNGDGTNDVFLIYAGPEVVSVKSLLIFDRWGEKVYDFRDFQPNDPAMGWDGTFRGRLLNQAVFVWFAEIEMQDGTTRIIEGDVTLVR